jgi:two-component system heavy metal sensor histidine kinase CusS
MSSKSVKPWSITARLTFFSILSATLILCAIGWYLYQSLANTFAEDNRQFLGKEIQLLFGVLQKQPLNLNHLAHEQNEGLDRYYSRILDEKGFSLSESVGMHLLPTIIEFPVASELAKAKGSIRTIADGRTVMLITVRDPKVAAYTIQMAVDMSHEAQLLAKYQHNLLGAVCLGLIFSALAALFVARRGLSPLADITRHIEGVTITQLHAQLDPAAWPKELSTLAVAFNAMLQRLAASFAQLTQFSADLAHELRTPINNLMGETEVMLSKPREREEYEEILASNLEEYGRLSRIVETLLFLARAENTEISLRATSLIGETELDDICSYHEALAEEKNIYLHCQGHGVLYADAQLFKRVLSNVLLNALQHTPAGGEIFIKLHATVDGGAEIAIQDTGYGIAAQHLAKLFNRFYRVDPARAENGTGLGLAIVKSIMDLHGGTVSLSSQPQVGTLLTLYFPPQTTPL